MNKRSDILSGIVLLCFLIGVSVPLFANQKEAKEVLDKTASAFRQSGGIHATFTVQTYVKSKLQNTSSGNIRLKGDKFLLDAEGVKTWFDGRTQWSYVAGNDEVNVAQPTSEELQSINPYAFLSIYEKGYDLKVGKKTVYAGKSVYCNVLYCMSPKINWNRFASVWLSVEVGVWLYVSIPTKADYLLPIVCLFSTKRIILRQRLSI